MTIHDYHEDSHTHGLQPGCPRCEEHANHPGASLDSENLARIQSGNLLTSLDRRAFDSLQVTRTHELSGHGSLRRCVHCGGYFHNEADAGAEEERCPSR